MKSTMRHPRCLGKPMYNIEEKQVQAQIQAHVEFTHKNKNCGEEAKEGGREKIISYRTCHSKHQSQNSPSNLKRMGRQGISKNKNQKKINNPIINTLAYEKTQVTIQRTQNIN